jgi:DNA-binding CsgD family transcriptional regulator
LIYKLAKPQNLPEFLSVSSKGMSSVFEEKNRLDSALFYAKEFILWSDSIVQRQNRESAFQLKSDYELKLALAERQKNQEAIVAQKERWLLIYGLIILALVTILVAVYAAFQRAVKKQKEKQVVELQLQAEKKKLESDLVLRDKELIANQIMLSETENRIESTLKEIKEAIVEPTGDRNTVLQKIAKQIEGKSGRKAISALNGYLQESDKRLFEALSKLHPDLTRAELRICAFIRLNLSTKEIAAISHQTSNSVKIARYRLRKKLKLGANENLVSYLNRLISANA